MTDVTTQNRICVSRDLIAGPYIMVPVSQLDDIGALLRSHGIHFWVGENAISLNGRPEVVRISFGRNADAAAVQGVLDSAS